MSEAKERVGVRVDGGGNIKAKAAAEFVSKCMFHCRRGVMECEEGIIVFGNDGYSSDGRARMAVEIARQTLAALDLEVTEFALDGKGYSWAMLAPNYDHLPIDTESLHESLSTRWASMDCAPPRQCPYCTSDDVEPVRQIHVKTEQGPAVLNIEIVGRYKCNKCGESWDTKKPEQAD